MLPDEGGIIKIFHVLCSANSKALTVDELEGRRKKVVSQVLDTLHNDVCRGMNAAAATAEFEAPAHRRLRLRLQMLLHDSAGHDSAGSL